MKKPAATVAPPAGPNGLPPAVSIALIAAAAAVAYANSFAGNFVFDDLAAIPDNPTLRSWRTAFSPPSGGLTVSGRPLLNASFAFNHALGGLRPEGYHALNLAIHVGAALLLFGLIRRTLGRQDSPVALRVPVDGFATTAALLWAVHPLQTEAVTYVVQRAESLAGFFFLLTFYCFARAADSARPGAAARWRWASVAACHLGLLTKETVATAPLLLVFYDRIFVSRSWTEVWRRHGVTHVAAATVWLWLGLSLTGNGGRGGTFDWNGAQPLWAYPLTQVEALTQYVRLTFWPRPLVADYGTFWVADPLTILPGLALWLLAGIGTLVALRRKPALGFLGAWFFVILAPTSLAPGNIQMIVEHRMYLPLAALILLALGVAQHLAGPRALWLAAALVPVAAFATWQRNPVYATSISLWQDTAKHRPQNARAWLNLGEALAASGRQAEAITALRQALAITPAYAEAHYGLGTALLASRRPTEAVNALLCAARLNPGHPETHYNLGLAMQATGRTPAAREAFAAALRLRPDYAQAHLALGASWAEAGRPEAALPHFSAAARLRPDDPDTRFNHANVLFQTGHPAEAIPEYEAVLRLAPHDAEAARYLEAARRALRP